MKAPPDTPIPLIIQIAFVLFARSGAPGEIRTPDPCLEGTQYKTLSAASGVAFTAERAIYLALELDRTWTPLLVLELV